MADPGSDNPQHDEHTVGEPDASRAGSASESTQPAFDHEVLAHLQVQSDEIFLHVQLFIDRGSERNRRQLLEYLKRFRNSLVLIDKIAAVYVIEELLTLMQSDAEHKIANRSELARVLATAAEQLCDYVATLQHDTRVSSALPLLPLVNDSRACREESLLSDTLVLAAGIELPSYKQAGLADGLWTEQRQKWVDFASSHHSGYARALLRWWRSGEYDAISPLVRILKKFAALCAENDFLHVIEPLFRSAAIVARAIEEKELYDGPALRSMFAQLERNIHRCSLVAAPEDLLPEDLLRNYLYYVAQTDSISRTAVELRRRFRLDRIREAALVNQSSMTPTIGVGYHLATAIRAGIANETAQLYSWLKQTTGTLPQPKLIRLSVRLSQLEPILSLMGEKSSLECLRDVNSYLQQIQVVRPVTDDLKLSLAQSLQKLDSLLDSSARHSITRGAGTVDRASVDGKDVFMDMAIDALLREARGSLRIAADDLALLFMNPDNDSTSHNGIIRHLKQINNALQILPLPEIDALIGGVCDVLKRAHASGQLGKDVVAAALINNESVQPLQRSDTDQDHFEANTTEQEIARLLVSVDFYLGCVLQPQPAASQLLVEANDALDNARQRIEAEDDTDALTVADTQSAALSMEDFHSPMDRLGRSLKTYRAKPESSSILAMQLALSDYRQIAGKEPDSPHAQLATSAESWLAKIATDAGILNEDQLRVVDEVHALMPQLIKYGGDGSSDLMPAFDELIVQLDSEAGAVEGRTLVDLTADMDLSAKATKSNYSEEPDIELLHEDELEPWRLDSTETDISTLTLNVDDDLLKAPPSAPEQPLDNTLQQVFYYECLGHLESLEESVRKALQPSADNSNRLPNEQMLRALHTLTSSAQTVEAHQVLAIVQPLQRAALARQRLEQSFDAPQTRYIGDLAMALRARLDAMGKGTDVGHSVKAVEQKLDSFIDSVLPGNETEHAADAADQTSSLEDVFVEEADELLERLGELVSTDNIDEQALQRSLGLLHTLKGSARMVGKMSIAETVHELESKVREEPDLESKGAVIKSGYRTIQSMMRQTADQQLLAAQSDSKSASIVESKSEGFQVSEKAFESLLDMSTELTINQARLSEELATLREVYQAYRATAKRWQKLPIAKHRPEFSVLHELMADLEAARESMRTALRQAEREQQQASRTSADLQQSLVRTRLVRIDEMQDRLSRTIQDACEASDVQARFTVEGGELTLDRSLFKKLLAPLDHIARNAVVHGIESSETRLASGKAAEGTLTLHASVDGTDLVIRFHDDGRGIDRELLNNQARERGESLIDTHEDLQRMLFRAGYSSVDKADELAGHGLGLAAVKAVVDDLGGSVQLSTASGAGTILTLRLPQRMVVNKVVLVSSAENLYAIPVSFVESVLVDGSIMEAPERYETYTVDTLLGREEDDIVKNRQRLATVIVKVRDRSLAISFDQVIGYRELVMQALGPQIASLNQFSGGSVLPDSRQALILDLVKLVDTMDPETQMAYKPAAESLRPVALIVDDSRTMRVAAEKVLRRCGVAVRLAHDGVEAMESVEKAMPNLVIVDLEMPRLDGMGLLQQLTRKYGRACPPLIVVSSRDDTVNRQKAESLGVVRFLAKPFTQSALLEAVESAGLRIPDLTIA
ncbi:MAG: response regulator [Granulosicoccus sp.]|nr:response regulator [Granulosicoccus sp.]